MHAQTLAELNRLAANHYKAEHAIFEARIQQRFLLTDGLKEIADEGLRQVPVRHRMSLEGALLRAEQRRHSWVASQGKKGGEKRPSDTLNTAIGQIVSENPKIQCAALIEKLAFLPELEFEGATIAYMNGTSEKQAPIVGLKDRLTRVRKKLAANHSR
jgi:hypothetical protein